MFEERQGKVTAIVIGAIDFSLSICTLSPDDRQLLTHILAVYTDIRIQSHRERGKRAIGPIFARVCLIRRVTAGEKNAQNVHKSAIIVIFCHFFTFSPFSLPFSPGTVTTTGVLAV